MRLNGYFFSVCIVYVIAICHVGSAQEDNGNLFEKTWGVDESVYKGDWGELAAYAPGGLDIDQDGNREFIVYDHVKGVFNPFDRLQVWENKGDNDFFLAWEHTYTKVMVQQDQGHGLSIADLDEDGMMEVLIATEGTMYIYEWDGTLFETGSGLPQEPTAIFDPLQDNAGASPVRQVRVVNLDPDPEPEIFLGYTYNTGLYMAIASLPNKDFSNPDWKDEYLDAFDNAGWRVGGVCIDDFDSDGKMEIFTSHWQDAPTTRLYENDGVDNYMIKFTTLPDDLILQPSFDDAFANPIFHDFDNDGKSEFVITDIHGKMFVITSDASNNFEDFGPSAWKYVMTLPGVRTDGFVRSGFLHDLDQDGKPDIYYNDKGAIGEGGVLDLEYQGGPVTDPDSWKVYKIYDNNGHLSVAGEVYPAGDLDGDGYGELVIVAWSNQPQDLVIIESLHAPTSVNDQTVEMLSEEYTLYQNYPNPFNSSTQIRFRLSRPGYAHIRIYDIMGREIVTLLKKYLEPGIHSVTFDGKDNDGRKMPSGIYLYQLEVENFIRTKRLVQIN